MESLFISNKDKIYSYQIDKKDKTLWLYGELIHIRLAYFIHPKTVSPMWSHMLLHERLTKSILNYCLISVIYKYVLSRLHVNPSNEAIEHLS